jgi:outer membrane receptor protein involved in Fe transport
MKKFLLLSLTLTFSSILFSQQNPWQGGGGGGGNMKGMMDKMKVGRLYGKIVDSTSSKPVEFASVQLIGNLFDTLTKAIKKDVVVYGQLTKENGDFNLEKVNVMGKYKIKIVSMGYETKEFSFSFGLNLENMKSGGPQNMMSAMNAMDKDLGNIKLISKATQLNAVEIVSAAPIMELKLDKKVFNVEKNVMSAGGTAEDVLKQVPTVSVDVDGNVSLRNAAPQIFVDGKPTTLTLDQIPADAIQNVEIITNPSAKYDASGGQAGILNLVLKKERRMGYNGNIRFGVDKYAKINSGADINAREGKVNIFLSGNFNQRHSLTKGTTDRENLIGIPLTNIYQDQYSITDGYFAMGRGGFDWFKDNRNTFSLSGKYMQGHFNPMDTLKTKTDTIYPSHPDSSSYNRLSKIKRQFENSGISFQYKHLFPKEGQEFTSDLNYNKSQFLFGGDYDSKYYNGIGNPIGSSILQNTKGNGHNDIFTAQSDLVLPLAPKDSLKKVKAKIETGIQGTYKDFASKSENFLMDNATQEYVLIKNQSVNYKYIDQIYAGYITYGRQKNKFSYQLGLRGESSFYVGELIDSNKTFKNIYPISLFPSGSATYDFNPKNNLQFSYSRRINRPSFFQLIPFTDYSDSLNLRRGNAGLKPEFTHSMEFSYLKTINPGNNILATVYFKNTTDLIASYQVQEFNSTLNRNAIISTYQNANAAYVYGAELTSKHGIKKWLEFTLNINTYYSVINAKNIQPNLTNERFSWFTKENFTFKLPENISIQLSPEYRSKASVPISRGGDNKFGGGGGPGGGGPGGMGPSNTSTAQGYIKERYSLDAAIKYEFMKNRAASISINVRDIFGTDINETITESEYFNQINSRLRDPHFIRVNFSYRFGKFDTSLFKRKNNKVNMDGMDVGM